MRKGIRVAFPDAVGFRCGVFRLRMSGIVIGCIPHFDVNKVRGLYLALFEGHRLNNNLACCTRLYLVSLCGCGFRAALLCANKLRSCWQRVYRKEKDVILEIMAPFTIISLFKEETEM